MFPTSSERLIVISDAFELIKEEKKKKKRKNVLLHGELFVLTYFGIRSTPVLPQ